MCSKTQVSASSPVPGGHVAPDGKAVDFAAFAQAAQLSSCALALVDVSGRVNYANAAFVRLLGLDGVGDGQPLVQRLAAVSDAERDTLARLLDEDGASTVTLKRIHAGVILDIGARGHAVRLVTATRISARPPRGGEIPAMRDPLTGLGNRLQCDDILAAWSASPTASAALAVLIIDLDRFKQVNDTLGHPFGDALLRLVAKRLLTVAQPEDTVLRLGGDEFMIIHPTGAPHIAAEALARRVIDLLERTFLVEGQQVNISASVGITLLHHDLPGAEQALKYADLALNAAKSAGRGAFRFFEPQLEEQALARRELEINLRRALALKEFSLVYQPQVSLKTRRLCSFEALIRWNCARYGPVSPAEFIPLAEEIGEIHAIGEWVLHTACQQAASWPDELSVAVNVSPLQFESGNIVAIVRDALESTGLAPQRLELEITEGTLINNSEAVLQRLWAIRAMGVGIAMDDFGTGYSSLSYLHSFPFSKLKIDQSFIRGERSPTSCALVEAILALGARLGMTTIAEGVETEEQFEALARSGCEKAQGYFVARPMPPEQIEAYCRHNALPARLPAPPEVNGNE